MSFTADRCYCCSGLGLVFLQVIWRSFCRMIPLAKKLICSSLSCPCPWESRSNSPVQLEAREPRESREPRPPEEAPEAGRSRRLEDIPAPAFSSRFHAFTWSGISGACTIAACREAPGPFENRLNHLFVAAPRGQRGSHGGLTRRSPALELWEVGTATVSAEASEVEASPPQALLPCSANLGHGGDKKNSLFSFFQAPPAARPTNGRKARAPVAL